MISKSTYSKFREITTTLSIKLVNVISIIKLEFIRMAKYSRALTNTSDILVSNNLPFLVDYMEKNNDFNPDKEYMISRKNTKKSFA